MEALIAIKLGGATNKDIKIFQKMIRYLRAMYTGRRPLWLKREIQIIKFSHL